MSGNLDSFVEIIKARILDMFPDLSEAEVVEYIQQAAQLQLHLNGIVGGGVFHREMALLRILIASKEELAIQAVAEHVREEHDDRDYMNTWVDTEKQLGNE